MIYLVHFPAPIAGAVVRAIAATRSFPMAWPGGPAAGEPGDRAEDEGESGVDGPDIKENMDGSDGLSCVAMDGAGRV